MCRRVEVHGCTTYERGGESPGNADQEEAECPIEDRRGRRVVFGELRRSRSAHPGPERVKQQFAGEAWKDLWTRLALTEFDSG